MRFPCCCNSIKMKQQHTVVLIAYILETMPWDKNCNALSARLVVAKIVSYIRALPPLRCVTFPVESKSPAQYSNIYALLLPDSRGLAQNKPASFVTLLTDPHDNSFSLCSIDMQTTSTVSK